MKHIQQVTIIGTGVMGGSFAKALKARIAAPPRLIGYDLPAVLHEALAHGLIDEARFQIEAAVRDADLVILAVPIRHILAHLAAIAPHLKSGAMVTDVGSVKAPIMAHAVSVLRPDNVFVGGHPMAGSEHSGPAHADAFLFENATYVICPPEARHTRTPHVQGVIGLVEQLGARIMMLDAERHDRIAATISHLPQLIAVTMMNLASELNQQDDAFLRLAAGGFRDITRIASSSFPMWRDILATNEPAIQQAILQFRERLGSISNHLHEHALDNIEQAFYEARDVRNTIPKNTKGFLHPLSDVYVFAEDKPGFLYHLTKTIYDTGHNIKDLELLKIREGTGGAFRLSFASDDEADATIWVLKEAGYVAYRL